MEGDYCPVDKRSILAYTLVEGGELAGFWPGLGKGDECPLAFPGFFH